jgi:probable HAF family extracellular repeat protein
MVDASVDRAEDAGAAADASPLPPATCSSSPGTLLDLGTLGSDTMSQAVDINDSGQVLCMSGGTFVWDNGTKQHIFNAVSVLAINNAGRVIGISNLPPMDGRLGTNPPAFWDNGVPQQLSFPNVVDAVSLAGLSNSGWIVGSARVQNGCFDCFDAFRWIADFQDLGTLGTPPFTGAVPPPSAHSSAAAVNDLGQVVGSTTTPTSSGHAFLAPPMIDLGTLGGPTSAAVGVNDAGQVTGTSDTATGTQQAFLWQAGSMQGLGSLNGGSSRAVAINASGQVLGNNDLGPGGAPGPRAFVWSAGTMIDLGTLGGPSSTAVAINDAGQVTGTSVTASGDTHAFLWQAGGMTDLGTLGGSFSRPTAINASGQVVGVSSIASGDLRAFLACPAAPATSTTGG